MSRLMSMDAAYLTFSQLALLGPPKLICTYGDGDTARSSAVCSPSSKLHAIGALELPILVQPIQIHARPPGQGPSQRPIQITRHHLRLALSLRVGPDRLQARDRLKLVRLVVLVLVVRMLLLVPIDLDCGRRLVVVPVRCDFAALPHLDDAPASLPFGLRLRQHRWQREEPPTRAPRSGATAFGRRRPCTGHRCTSRAQQQRMSHEHLRVSGPCPCCGGTDGAGAASARADSNSARTVRTRRGAARAEAQGRMRGRRRALREHWLPAAGACGVQVRIVAVRRLLLGGGRGLLCLGRRDVSVGWIGRWWGRRKRRTREKGRKSLWKTTHVLKNGMPQLLRHPMHQPTRDRHRKDDSALDREAANGHPRE
ncbi:hypothetical protein C8J57DRAFT_1470566 [Mycena rebaudengoi]|nr:hypothetical protein C8J57DRAFT_1470566 [Mycena rebaudengoi]